MWQGVDAGDSPIEGPVRYRNLLVLLYFLPLLVLSLLFVVKIYLAVYVDPYEL